MREVLCADALPWLRTHNGLGAVITSLPDAAEMGLDVGTWRAWFHEAASLVMQAVDPFGPVVFYQTDRKHEGALISKVGLIQDAATTTNCRILWHKIVLRRPVGAIDLHRPGYSHLIAVSRHGRPGSASPDVIPAGRLIYPNAMGLTAALAAVRFALASARTVCDPFCGRGTVLAVTEALGGDAIGLDIDPAQVAAARTLRLRLPSYEGPGVAHAS